MMARSRQTDQRYYGVAEAIVVDVNDPGKQGRVKLNFPWFDGGEAISDWSRVAQTYAGNGYGSFFVPEVGDEVLVAFIHGDLRLPIVVGALYNGSDLPATHRASDKDEKLIRTRAGHQVLMVDTAGQEKVEVTTKKGHKLVLDDAGDSITLSHQGGSTTMVLTASEVTVNCQTMTVNGVLVARKDTSTTINGNTITGA